MHLPKYFNSHLILTCTIGQLCMFFLQACGSTELISQVDVLGSYLYVDELNIPAGGHNQLHLACRRSNGKPLASVAVQIAVSKAGADPDILVQDWLKTDIQGQQHITFTLPDPGMYTLALQIKLPGSTKVFPPPHTYTIVQVLEEKEIGIQAEVSAYNASIKPTQAIARGIALNTQLLLLDKQLQLQRGQETTIRFRSSDPLAILPQPIQITGAEGGNKLILQGSQLYTLGEQTILAIDDETSRIVSEQRYQVTLGPKVVYRAVLSKPQVSVIADGQRLATVGLTLTDGNGEPMKNMQVALAIGQGSAIRSLPAQTDELGMASFSWSETVAGNKSLELFLQVPSGMLPIQKDTLYFAPGSPSRLSFVAWPTFGIAGETLETIPIVQVLDALGNTVAINDVPVTLTLASILPGASSTNIAGTPFAGETTALLREGSASFPDVAILLANDFLQLVASAPGIAPAQSSSFVIAPAPSTKLEFTIQPATGLAYGVSNPVRIAVQDNFGNFVPENGIPIHLTLAGASIEHQLIGSTSATTNNGIANLDAGINRSGSDFFVVASAPTLQATTSQVFHVSTGMPDGIFSQIIPVSGGSPIANGENNYTLEVQLRDGQNTPIAGFPVGVSSPLGQVQAAYPFGALTDNNGIIRIELSSTLAGEKNILIEMGNINRLVSPKPVFLPGTPEQANLSLDQQTLILDSLRYLTVTGRLEDINGNLLPNTPYTLVSDVPTDTITPSSGITNNQGRLSAIWRGTLASTTPRGLRLQSGSYLSAPTPAIFRSGAPSLMHSTLVASPNTVIADGQSTVLLQTRIADEFNNPIPAVEVLFSVSGKGNLLPDALVYTDASGMAQANLRSFASQDKQIEIKLGLITLQATATFLPLPCVGTPILPLGIGNQSLRTGSRPSGVVSADFNQDTIDDLAITSMWEDTLDIFLGRADGTFAPRIPYQTWYGPAALTALDVNRDGLVDLAVINQYSNNLKIFYSQGDGTFLTSMNYPTGSEPFDLTPLDANRDGIMDLAVVNLANNSLGIFLGLTDGNFAEQVTYATGNTPSALTTLDANRDGIMDLAVANQDDDTIGIFLGQSNGTFADQVTFATGSYGPYALTTLDANRDGIVDLVVGYLGSNTLGIFLGRADATFAGKVSYATDVGSIDLTTLDANRDGLTDLAVVNYWNSQLNIFLGRANGTFAERITYETGSLPVALTAALDTNRDGLKDIAIVNAHNNSTSILLGQPDGTFATQTTPEGERFNTVALADLDANRDGILDLAIVNSGLNTLGISLGRGDGTFAEQVTYPTGYDPSGIATLDTNRDGLVDLAVPNFSDDTFDIFLGQTDGVFTQQGTYATDNGPNKVATLDTNRDGMADLAILNWVSSTLGIFHGQVDGTFDTQTTYSTGNGPSGITTLDSNHDGLMDIAVVNYYSNTLGIYLGQVNGTFANQVIYSAESTPRDVAVLDANRDGLVDLAVANENGYGLSIFLGQANGTLGIRTDYVSVKFSGALRILDINQDLIQDIFAYGPEAGLHMGLANGDFAPVILYNQRVSVAIVNDFDKDYIPDLVITPAPNGLAFIERQYCQP